jgi:uncharacterized protein
MIERISLDTTDGETLEGRWDSPDRAHASVVFCHPHPLQGGTMMAPLMIAITGRLMDRGFAVLRFNFRGIGASTGQHENGVGELHDLDAAMSHAARSARPINLAGWSFGAGLALAWLGRQAAGIPYAGVAPATSLLPDTLPPGPKRIVIGTRDQVIQIDQIQAYAETMSIDLVLTPGDHFFHGRGKRVGDLVAQGFE